MAATTAIETKLDITRNRITASVPLYLQSDLHVNGTLGVNNIATFKFSDIQQLKPTIAAKIYFKKITYSQLKEAYYE